jgi:hypothetical protein
VNKTTHKFVLVYSEKADREFGHNVARLEDGTEVKYTLMHNQEDGPWQDHYKWTDAVEVGGIDSHRKIVKWDNRHHDEMLHQVKIL